MSLDLRHFKMAVWRSNIQVYAAKIFFFLSVGIHQMTSYPWAERNRVSGSYWQKPILVPLNALCVSRTLSITYHHACIPRGVRQRCTNVHPQFASMFRSHVIGGEPIAIKRAQIQTPSCYWEFHRKTQQHFLLDPGIEPKTSSVAVALRTTRLPRQFHNPGRHWS